MTTAPPFVGGDRPQFGFRPSRSPSCVVPPIVWAVQYFVSYASGLSKVLACGSGGASDLGGMICKMGSHVLQDRVTLVSAVFRMAQQIMEQMAAGLPRNFHIFWWVWVCL